jgi:transcriptional regulator with XRE-family HTH domain
MFDQVAFGEKLKNQRKEKNLTQEEVAEKIGVSGQAVSKWEKGECLPDVYNLKMLGKLYRVSVDSLLEMASDREDKVIETYKIENAVFELVERPETIYAGEMTDETSNFKGQLNNFDKIRERVLPERDICVSLNFWNNNKMKKILFAREVTTEKQPDGIDVYKVPAGLFLRVYTNKDNASIIGKDICEPWEFFSFMFNCVMPKYHLKVSRNENGEDNGIEFYDSDEDHDFLVRRHKIKGTGWAYAAVVKAQREV